MSEGRRMLSRVIFNYAGLFASLVIGIVLTRELIRVLGSDGFGLVALLGTTAGIGVMIQDIVKQTMIRELGYALHHEEQDFKAIQADAFGVSTVVALLTALVFGTLWLLVPVLEVPDSWGDAARWFIVAKALQSIVFVMAAPLYNLYLITERMAWANALIVLERLAMLGCIAGVAWLALEDAENRLIAYGFLSAAAISIVTISAALGITILDRQFRPDLRRMTSRGVRSLLKQSTVQGTAVTAVNLHPRIGGFIVNAFVGLAGNMAYGLGFQFASYIRRVAVGMTQGLDAVSARFSAGRGDKDVRWLLRRSTQLHAAVIFPFATFAIVFAGDLIDLWIGDLIADEDEVRGLIVPCVVVLSVGMSARALSDAWIRILYGAGKVKRYVWPVVIAAVLNPLMAIALCQVLPEAYVVIGPPLAMGLIFLLIHCGWIGMITMRELGVGPGSVYMPLIGPAIGAIISTGVTLGLLELVALSGTLELLLAVIIFGTAYTTFGVLFLTTPQHRAQIRRRLGLFSQTTA